MECWYYDAKDLENTPSRKDGIDKDTEDRYRKEGAKFINEVGQALNLYPFYLLPLIIYSCTHCSVTQYQVPKNSIMQAKLYVFCHSLEHCHGRHASI